MKKTTICIFVLCCIGIILHGQENVTFSLSIPQIIENPYFVPVLLKFENKTNEDVLIKKPTIINSGIGGMYIPCYTKTWSMGVYNSDSLIMHNNIDLMQLELPSNGYKFDKLILSFFKGFHVYNVSKLLRASPTHFVLKRRSKKKIRALIYISTSYKLFDENIYRIEISYIDDKKDFCYKSDDIIKISIK